MQIRRVLFRLFVLCLFFESGDETTGASAEPAGSGQAAIVGTSAVVASDLWMASE
jgi:hypothetical protein